MILGVHKYVWINGIRCETMTEVYNEFGASKKPAMEKVRECLRTEQSYKGKKISFRPPVKKVEKKRVGEESLLAPGHCTHRLGFNSGRHV